MNATPKFSQPHVATDAPSAYDLALSFYRDQSAGRASPVNLRALPILDVIRAAQAHAAENPSLRRLARIPEDQVGMEAWVRERPRRELLEG